MLFLLSERVFLHGRAHAAYSGAGQLPAMHNVSSESPLWQVETHESLGHAHKSLPGTMERSANIWHRIGTWKVFQEGGHEGREGGLGGLTDIIVLSLAVTQKHVLHAKEKSLSMNEHVKDVLQD